MGGVVCGQRVCATDLERGAVTHGEGPAGRRSIRGVALQIEDARGEGEVAGERGIDAEGQGRTAALVDGEVVESGRERSGDALRAATVEVEGAGAAAERGAGCRVSR